jgi:hypothetical protein
MKQQPGNESAASGHPIWGQALGELDDLDAWEGYEFWSAQLEAQMEDLDEVEWFDKPEPSGPKTPATATDERERDVLPF